MMVRCPSCRQSDMIMIVLSPKSKHAFECVRCSPGAYITEIVKASGDNPRFAGIASDDEDCFDLEE